MMRKPSGKGSCAVCGTSDARALVTVGLTGGAEATLCGTHDLMHRRAAKPAATIAELKDMFSNRRSFDRRSPGSDDVLAESLSSAFVRERRGASRRAS